MRLALGTAQFGLDYGITNNSGQTPEEEVAKIINRSSILGIDTLDTAPVYGDSELILGKIGLDHWNIITKLPKYQKRAPSIKFWIKNHINDSLTKLGINQLDAVLLHDASDLLKDEGLEIAETLQEIRNEGLVNKVGFSIYSPDSLNELFKVMTPDIVQVPINVLDQRLITSHWLHKLNNMNIEIHGRSIFLQGLLLMDKNKRPKYFDQWKEVFMIWENFLRKHNISPLEACLYFVRQIKSLSKVIVGVNDLRQLEEVISIWKHSRDIDFQDLLYNDPKLIDPRNWKET